MRRLSMGNQFYTAAGFARQLNAEQGKDYEGIFGAKQLSVCDSGICSCGE